VHLLQIMLRREHRSLAEKTAVRYIKGHFVPDGEIHIEFVGQGRKAPTYYAVHMTPDEAEELILDLAANTQLCRHMNVADGIPEPNIFKQIAAGLLEKVVERLRSSSKTKI
jgi:hypothetical protein